MKLLEAGDECEDMEEGSDRELEREKQKLEMEKKLAAARKLDKRAQRQKADSHRKHKDGKPSVWLGLKGGDGEPEEFDVNPQTSSAGLSTNTKTSVAYTVTIPHPSPLYPACKPINKAVKQDKGSGRRPQLQPSIRQIRDKAGKHVKYEMAAGKYGKLLEVREPPSESESEDEAKSRAE